MDDLPPAGGACLMPTGRLAFKETDLIRALRAALKFDALFHVRIEKATGDILILPGIGQPVQGGSAQPASNDDLDQELAEWEARQKS
ncbi:MAG: hypothetical protein KKG14_10335 [Alphaproteobacteria bacterium]|nr:hypothetical protein [Alphaproteobacteria bacterium]MBU2270649.1 hypothetical protein [Alphaproteobacteria bacterium]MBU2419086.1 hypothetical protein [Alphaproteobacteria bacterium]